MKLAGRSLLPNYEIVAFLGIFMAMFISLYALVRGEVKELWPKRPTRLLGRASLDVANNLCVVIALRHLSLTLFYILVFTSPLLVAVLGRIFLKERLDWRKATAILAGFLGVVVAVYPSRSSGSSAWAGFAACVVCVTCFSVAVVWSRVISQTERAESMTWFSALLSAAVGLAGMLFHAAPLDSRLFVALLAMGLLCAIGSICIVVALRYTTAATVSQYHYTQLVVGSVVAYFLFNEKPTIWMLSGAVLIIAAGLYIALWAPDANRGA
ncbi:Permeases of the drug/metabolite transporter (DMT) superfamily [Acidisarcina polymorpha]|uniref:Permeases of the drug/metabolite transporter (DMT) superfamily n=2 Tax=Acidisarcina polymorpha TaxID=2211140 RepID=A0A2Z5G569_9BACT|nr:DMT family transporter [Acidisarcina polymorpha]AXC14120.1 Permeases of the drug/metabolite transporter (DMT) superfamily [Acidisarcina polymorpha]